MGVVQVNDRVITEGRVGVGLVMARMDGKQGMGAIGMGVGGRISQQKVSFSQQFRPQAWQRSQCRWQWGGHSHWSWGDQRDGSSQGHRPVQDAVVTMVCHVDGCCSRVVWRV